MVTAVHFLNIFSKQFSQNSFCLTLCILKLMKPYNYQDIKKENAILTFNSRTTQKSHHDKQLFNDISDGPAGNSTTPYGTSITLYFKK